MYRTDFRTLWEKVRVGCFERTALKHVYYLWWNRSPAQVGCMRHVLEAGALGRPRGIRWRGRWEGGSGWGIHVNPWLIRVNVWQKPLQYCKVSSLQLIKINENKKINKCIKKNRQHTGNNSFKKLNISQHGTGILRGKASEMKPLPAPHFHSLQHRKRKPRWIPALSLTLADGAARLGETKVTGVHWRRECSDWVEALEICRDFSDCSDCSDFSEIAHLVSWAPIIGDNSWSSRKSHLKEEIIFDLTKSQASPVVKNLPACQCKRCKRCGFDLWVRNIPWRRKWQPTPVFLPGECHGQRCLPGYTPWGRKDSDTI